MTDTLRRRSATALVAVTVLVSGWLLWAQPARDRIIDSAYVSAGEDGVMLVIELTAPFRYLSHVPLDTGRELRIRIQPVRVSSADYPAVFEREAVVPPDGEPAAVDLVVYDGDAPDGPWLTVRFSRLVRYQVIPAGDYRGVYVLIEELL
jgi:hypothetical protein